MPEQMSRPESMEIQKEHSKLRELARQLELQELVHTTEFKKWFGDWENDPEEASKMINEEGSPRTFYFGGHANIEQLQGDKRDRTGDDEIGFYVSPSKRYAKFYAEALRDPITDESVPSAIYTVVINARHPKRVSADDKQNTQRVTELPEDCDAFINEPLQEVVVFDPEQILIINEKPVN